MRRAVTVAAGALLALSATTGAALAVPAAVTGAGSGVVAGPAPRPMPDFLGKGLIRVYNELDYRQKVEVKDVSAAHRKVLWPFNWKVCEQYPAAGKRLEGQTVRVGVVKKGEACP
ncbi:hypothetical protein [Streptomyces sp. NPDC050504]|uniref:hypothetical protein n=1 Tax=Streptomyces sp. NPDC050504 TaxID=3365618 RepID=UPI0037B34C03